jgi:hypothetical protein
MHEFGLVLSSQRRKQRIYIVERMFSVLDRYLEPSSATVCHVILCERKFRNEQDNKG